MFPGWLSRMLSAMMIDESSISVASLSSSNAIYRVRSVDCDLVLKLATERELVVQRWVGQVLPLAVLGVVAAMPCSDVDVENRWVVATNAVSSDASMSGAETYASGLRKMAELHVSSAHRMPDVLSMGLSVRAGRLEYSSEEVGAVASAIELVNELLGLKIDPGMVNGLRAARSLLGSGVSLGSELCLAHGDLHQNNMLTVDDHVVLIDWADACISGPQWDLIFCNENMIDAYLAWSGVRNQHAFYKDLRIAVLFRCFEMLKAAVGFALSGQAPETTVTVKAFLSRIVQAAETREFRG